MSLVNRYKFRLPNLSGTSATTINIPVDMDFQLVDQCELVEHEFVAVEIENSVNPILDYEKARFGPTPPPRLNQIFTLVDGILYRVNFLNDTGTYNPNTFYGNIGFSDDDLKFRKNSFMKSFLTLNFYDTDIGTDQRLLNFVTLFPNIISTDYNQFNELIPAKDFPVQFKLANPLKDRDNNGEGYFLYYFKDEVSMTLPKEMYMRATFNNAKTGEAVNFMSSSNTQMTIEELVGSTMGTPVKNNLYTKYILKRGNDGYYYEIDEDYSDNVMATTNNYCVDLYQITAI